MTNTQRSLGIALALTLLPAVALARKPEDVFKGQIIITKKRLPSNFSSAEAFISAVKSAKQDKVWPREQKGNDHALWKLEYIAFFARPLNDYEVQVKFFDVTGGGRRYVAGDAQMTRDKAGRVFASDIEVSKPDFDVNKKYMMTVESRGQTIAKTTFWLVGKADSYSGKVEFSDEEAGGRKK